MKNEVAPPGWSGTVTAMRVHHAKEIDNPWALAWSMKAKGDKPHYKKAKGDRSTDGKVPAKKNECGVPTFTEWLAGRVDEHRLSAGERDGLGSDEFALPGRRYPIPDEGHARNAEARVSKFGTPGEKKRVRAAVHKRYPDIGGG